jgi:hypothetical protein
MAIHKNCQTLVISDADYRIGIEPEIQFFSKKLVRDKSAPPPHIRFTQRINAPGGLPWRSTAAARCRLWKVARTSTVQFVYFVLILSP